MRSRATVVLLSLALVAVVGAPGATPAEEVECDANSTGAVRVAPAPTVAARFLQGTAWCRSSDPERTFEAPNVDRLVAGVAIFGVRVVDGGTIVKVSKGFVEIESGGRTGLVGPGQELTVRDGSMPQAPQPVMLTDEDRASVSRLEGGAPSPVYPRPATARDSISVGYVTPMPPTTFSLVRRFFDFVANEWGASLRLVPVLPERIGPALAGNEVDVLVVRGRASVGTPALQFANDPAGMSYSIAFPATADVATPLRGFLQTALEQGRYGELYRDAYQRGPDYQPFRDLVLEPARPTKPTKPPRKPPKKPVTDSGLPTTGVDLTLLVVAGGLLLVLGVGLRRLARRPH